MSNRLCFVTEEIQRPFDEGIKKTVFEIIKVFRRQCHCLVIGRRISPALGISLEINRLLYSMKFFRLIKDFEPQAIVYIPYSSLTLASFVRAKILSKIRVPIAVVGLQPREYFWWQLTIIKLLKPDIIFVQSKRSMDFWERSGIRSSLISSGADPDIYKPVDKETRHRLRKKYGIPENKIILLHVGHINRGRGIQELGEFKTDTILPVIVGSTSTKADVDLYSELKAQGCIVISRYVERIEHFYQMADIYVFPTSGRESAIEFPLSVVEALSCGLSVLSKPYGGLVDHFAENERLQFYTNVEQGRNKIIKLLQGSCVNNKVNTGLEQEFSWIYITNDILSKIKDVIK